MQVFSQKGYHSTRMEEIAVAAGIGKGTIYEYFESKVQLFQEMLEKSLQVYYSSLSKDQMDQLTIRERFFWLFEAHFKFCYENRKLSKIVFWDDVFDEELKEWSHKIHNEKERHMQALIEEGIRRGELKEVDVKMASMMVIGIMGAIWVPLALEGWQIDPTEIAQKVTDLIMHGLAPDK